VTTVHVVVPDDDAVRPSGGTSYDERICAGLAAAGWDVRVHPVPGGWPRPAAAALTDLAGAVASVPDRGLVVVDGLVASAASALLAAESARVRLVVLVHMPVPGSAGDPAGERAVLGAARAVVTTSAWTRSVLLARYRVDPGRVHVVHPGTDLREPAPGSASGGHLLCVAAVAAHKGQDLLLEALADLPGTWTCDLVGPLDRDPDFGARLRERIDGSGLADRVHLRGPEVGEALDRTYRSADLLVHPSRLEAYGMVVAEALAAGLPVVAADVGGIPEALGSTPEGPPGLLVPPEDPRALAEALRHWLGNADLRTRLRRRALVRRAGLPGWDTAAARLAPVLTAVAAEPDAERARVPG
jgi:glycosyltransferase involved in cell wall biosynthesis